MTKTDKLGLPQWEATDQVQRTDFNDAFAILDDGYAAAETATAGLARARALAERLGRDAYSLAAQQAVQHGSWGDGAAFWLNPLTTLAAAGGEGHGWNGRYGIRLGPDALPTAAYLEETAEELSYAGITPSKTISRTAALTFRSDGYGTLETVAIWFWKNTNYSGQTDVTFYVTMTDADTGEELGKAGPFTASGSIWTSYTVNFPLDTTRTYQLTFTVPDSVVFYGQAGFLLGSKEQPHADRENVTLIARDFIPTVVTQVEKPDAAQEAVALIRWAGDGNVALTVDGGADPVLRETRQTCSALGETCQESTYDLASLPDGPLTVTLTMSPGTGNFAVFDYGLLWR
jgi:hypothetical protein